MGGLFGGNTPKAAPPPPAPVDNSAEIERAKQLELQKRKLGGRASTILTKEEDVGEATTSSKKLLGA